MGWIEKYDSVLPITVFCGTWLLMSNAYAVLDMWQPEWYRRCSCRWIHDSKPDEPMTWAVWWKLFSNNLRNLCFASVIVFFMFDVWLVSKTPWFQSWYSFYYCGYMAEFFGCYVWGELWFWLSHFLIHQSKTLMKAVHRQHHEYCDQLYSMVGFYCSLSEMCIINLPLAIGFAVLVKVNFKILSLWLGILAWHISNNHSAHYLLPKRIDNPNYHRSHHIHYSHHYGAFWAENFFHGIYKFSQGCSFLIQLVDMFMF